MRDYLAERLAREEIPEAQTGDWEELFAWSEEEAKREWPEGETRTSSSVTELQELRESMQNGMESETLETLAGRVSDLVAEKITGADGTLLGETAQDTAQMEGLSNLLRRNQSVQDLSRDGSLWIEAEKLRSGSGTSAELGQADLTALDRAVEREARRYDGAYTFY